MNTPQPSSGRGARIPSLDGLRGISIGAVILAHAVDHFRAGSVHRHLEHTVLSNLAYLGVTVFFVISGFLITTLLLRDAARPGGIRLGAFYRRRAVRILPASLVYIAVVIALGHPSRAQAIYALTFSTSFFFEHAYRGLQQLWSLSVEEQFYLVWPLVMLAGERIARRCGWAVLLASPLVRLALVASGHPQLGHLGPAIADSLGSGCMLALYREPIRQFCRRRLLSAPRFVALCLGTVVLAELLYEKNLVALWGIIPCLVCLILSVAIEREDRILNAGPLVWLGLLSYSLYLWQQPFLVLGGPLDFFPARITAALLCAWLSYRFVEQPFLRLAGGAGRASFGVRRLVPATAQLRSSKEINPC